MTCKGCEIGNQVLREYSTKLIERLCRDSITRNTASWSTQLDSVQQWNVSCFKQGSFTSEEDVESLLGCFDVDAEAKQEITAVDLPNTFLVKYDRSVGMCYQKNCRPFFWLAANATKSVSVAKITFNISFLHVTLREKHCPPLANCFQFVFVAYSLKVVHQHSLEYHRKISSGLLALSEMWRWACSHGLVVCKTSTCDTPLCCWFASPRPCSDRLLFLTLYCADVKKIISEIEDTPLENVTPKVLIWNATRFQFQEFVYNIHIHCIYC